MATTEDTNEQDLEDRELARLAAETEAAAVSANHAALERAVSDLPNVPGRDEFLSLCQMARVMSQSGVVPRALQGKPADVLVVLMTGRDLGIPVTAALRKVYVIDGQPSIAPQLKMALIRKRGLGRVVPHPDNDQLEDRQGAIPLGPGGYLDDDGKPHGALGPTYWYRWQDAVIAGLVRDGCTPTAHTVECNAARGKDGVRQFNGRTANFCKDNWRKNPRRMLFQRASGFVADDYFSEASSGLYDPDELGSMLDDDGRLIDANHVELPVGFDRGHNDGDGGLGEQVDASPEDTWALQLRVHALPEDAQAEYKQRWKQAKVPGRLTAFPAAKHNLVESLLRGVEQQWRAQRRYDPDAGPAAFAADVLAPTAAAASGMPPGTPPRDRTAAETPPEAAQDAAGAPEPTDAAATAEPASGTPQAAQGGNGGQPEPGALPLDAPEPAGPLLAIPDAVRSASDDDKAEWAMNYVKAMKLAKVDDLLRGRYGRDTKGAPGDRRSRLTLLVLERELGVAGAEAAAD